MDAKTADTVKRPRQKKPIPLSGDTLSTGVKIEKATASQLGMEVNRTIKQAALRFAEVKSEDDVEYRAAMDRTSMFLSLAKERLKREAACLSADHPHHQAIEDL